MLSNFIKFSLSLLLFSVAGFSFSQTAEDIVFEKSIQKFMKVDEGHQITLTYNFTYKGVTPLQLLSPKVDCDCTSVEIPKEDIKQNNSYQIIVHFNTNDKIGFQERPIKLTFLSTENNLKIEKEIVFKGMVKASKETKEKYKSH
ncbi:MAG: DUF1573 domain-containing protein [Flavobacteriales bacterium]|nr:DUF1573 domain-containing protein [Flavobacteriales bacterium]MCB9363136.1 DUF1573 domain-containing protein [Flavobacteriales bacterium]